jgi:hypothetical protein
MALFEQPDDYALIAICWQSAAGSMALRAGLIA